MESNAKTTPFQGCGGSNFFRASLNSVGGLKKIEKTQQNIQKQQLELRNGLQMNGIRILDILQNSGLFLKLYSSESWFSANSKDTFQCYKNIFTWKGGSRKAFLPCLLSLSWPFGLKQNSTKLHQYHMSDPLMNLFQWNSMKFLRRYFLKALGKACLWQVDPTLRTNRNIQLDIEHLYDLSSVFWEPGKLRFQNPPLENNEVPTGIFGSIHSSWWVNQPLWNLSCHHPAQNWVTL